MWSFGNNKAKNNKDDFILNLTSSEDLFYKDSELNEMMIVDKILQSVDDTEKTIIEHLLSGENIEQIALASFLTEGGVKYRINKIISKCGAKDKDEIIRLLKKYIK